MLSWLYKDEPKSQVVQTSDFIVSKLPSKLYGLGNKLIAKMGYPGQGPLGVRGKGLVVPLPHTGRENKDKVGLGFKKKPYHLKGNYSHVIEQIAPREPLLRKEEIEPSDSDSDSSELIPFEKFPKEIKDLLDDKDDPIKRINVVETQEPTINQEMVATQDPDNLKNNQEEGSSSDSKIDSHEYEFKSKSEGNPSWGIHTDFTHVLRFPRDPELEAESNDYE